MGRSILVLLHTSDVIYMTYPSENKKKALPIMNRKPFLLLVPMESYRNGIGYNILCSWQLFD